MSRPRGRPAGGGGERREVILAAARTRFAEQGYAASLREIAADAGVDRALVAHYFGNKQGLFLAALALPIDPTAVIGAALTGDRSGAAGRLLRAALTAWDEQTEAFATVLRTGLTEPSLVPDIAAHLIVPTVRAHLDGPDADLRAALVASMMVGLGLQRHVVRLEPVASASHDDLMRTYAPALNALLDPAAGSGGR